MEQIYTPEEKYIFEYLKRTANREIRLMKSTMDFIAYFMGLGDSQTDAEIKVSQISTEVAALLYVYTLGNKQPLIDAINDSTLSFMDAPAKAKLIADLTI